MWSAYQTIRPSESKAGSRPFRTPRSGSSIFSCSSTCSRSKRIPWWAEIAGIATAEVERRALAGDVQAALQATHAIVHEAGPGGRELLRGAAQSTVDKLASGRLARHLVVQLRKVDDDGVEPIAQLCHAVGPRIVKALAEALMTEDNTRAVRRLRDLLLGFGAAGRETVEQLKLSPNPTARRTAIELLRMFGGRDALTDLAAMLGDGDPQVQREAVRALVHVGSPGAIAIVRRALDGDASTTVLQELMGLRDEKVAPLLCPLLARSKPRGLLIGLHTQIMDALGGLGGHPDSVQALRAALYRGEWWAPTRTAVLRRAAAAALRRIGTPDALAVLEEAAQKGTRGVRMPRGCRCESRRSESDSTHERHAEDQGPRGVAASVRSCASRCTLYAPAHPLVARSIDAFAEILGLAHATASSIVIGIVGEELVVGDVPVPRAAESMGKLIRQLEEAGIERIVIDRGVQASELSQLVQTLGGDAKDATKALGRLTHVRVGRLQVEKGAEAPSGDIATYRRLYDDAVSVAETLWDSAKTEGNRMRTRAEHCRQPCARGVANRPALLALTALKAMRQLHVYAHGERIHSHDGAGARSGHRWSVAARAGSGRADARHWQGQDPADILNKADKLTDGEFDILRRHTIDGAEILETHPGDSGTGAGGRLRAPSAP